jgi:hypothetical protein
VVPSPVSAHSRNKTRAREQKAQAGSSLPCGASGDLPDGGTAADGQSSGGGAARVSVGGSGACGAG